MSTFSLNSEANASEFIDNFVSSVLHAYFCFSSFHCTATVLYVMEWLADWNSLMLYDCTIIEVFYFLYWSSGIILSCQGNISSSFLEILRL